MPALRIRLQLQEVGMNEDVVQPVAYAAVDVAPKQAAQVNCRWDGCELLSQPGGPPVVDGNRLSRAFHAVPEALWDKQSISFLHE